MSKTVAIIGAVILALLAVLVVMQLLAVVPGLRALSAGGEERGIMVMGEGKASAEPDVAMISVGVETRTPTAREAAGENKERMSDVMEALRGMAIAEEDLQTLDYRIQPEIDWDDGEPRVIGYVASSSVVAKIRQIDQVGDVLDAVTEAGANNIHGIQFTLEDPTSVHEQARAEAVADAQSKAEALATLAGVGLGKPRIIRESFIEPPPLFMERAYVPAVETGAGVPVSPGRLEMTVQVDVTFDIR